MFRRVFLFGALALGAACGSGEARAGQRSGRLVISRVSRGPQTLLDLPALARYCEQDSTLSIVAVGDQWSGAVAMHSAWPVTSGQPFTIANTLGAAGSGAVAVRPLADTSQLALVGERGTITITPGATLTGRFEADVPGSSGPPVRLTGTFEGLTVHVGACP